MHLLFPLKPYRINERYAATVRLCCSKLKEGWVSPEVGGWLHAMGSSDRPSPPEALNSPPQPPSKSLRSHSSAPSSRAHHTLPTQRVRLPPRAGPRIASRSSGLTPSPCASLPAPRRGFTPRIGSPQASSAAVSAPPPRPRWERGSECASECAAGQALLLWFFLAKRRELSRKSKTHRPSVSAGFATPSFP